MSLLSDCGPQLRSESMRHDCEVESRVYERCDDDRGGARLRRQRFDRLSLHRIEESAMHIAVRANVEWLLLLPDRVETHHERCENGPVHLQQRLESVSGREVDCVRQVDGVECSTPRHREDVLRDVQRGAREGEGLVVRLRRSERDDVGHLRLRVLSGFAQ